MTPQAGPMPSDFSVVYEWRAGSMPPPYHYEYTVTVGPGGNGKIVYSPSYPGKDIPEWTETFDVTGAQLASLYDTAVQHNILRDSWPTSEPSVGGSVEWADIYAGGKHYSIPVSIQPSSRAAAGYMYDAVKALVPPSLWDKLEAQRKQWADNYKK